MSRVLNCLTQDLITLLCQLLENNPRIALETLTLSAPVLVDQLKQVKSRAVDTRDVGHALQGHLQQWLATHPQTTIAASSLLSIPELVCPGFEPRNGR